MAQITAMFEGDAFYNQRGVTIYALLDQAQVQFTARRCTGRDTWDLYLGGERSARTFPTIEAAIKYIEDL